MNQAACHECRWPEFLLAGSVLVTRNGMALVGTTALQSYHGGEICGGHRQLPSTLLQTDHGKPGSTHRWD